MIQGIYSSFTVSTLCKNVFAKTKIECIQILHFKCARWDSKAVYYIISCPFLRHQTQFTKKDLTPWDNNLPSAQFIFQNYKYEYKYSCLRYKKRDYMQRKAQNIIVNIEHNKSR